MSSTHASLRGLVNMSVSWLLKLTKPVDISLAWLSLYQSDNQSSACLVLSNHIFNTPSSWNILSCDLTLLKMVRAHNGCWRVKMHRGHNDCWREKENAQKTWRFLELIVAWQGNVNGALSFPIISLTLHQAGTYCHTS